MEVRVKKINLQTAILEHMTQNSIDATALKCCLWGLYTKQAHLVPALSLYRNVYNLLAMNNNFTSSFQVQRSIPYMVRLPYKLREARCLLFIQQNRYKDATTRVSVVSSTLEHVCTYIETSTKFPMKINKDISLITTVLWAPSDHWFGES